MRDDPMFSAVRSRANRKGPYKRSTAQPPYMPFIDVMMENNYLRGSSFHARSLWISFILGSRSVAAVARPQVAAAITLCNVTSNTTHVSSCDVKRWSSKVNCAHAHTSATSPPNA